MASYTASAIFNAIDNVTKVVDKIADNVTQSMSTVASAVLEASGTTGALADIWSAAAGGPLAMFNAALSDGVEYLVESRDATLDFAARTGESGEQLELFSQRAQDLFGTGLVSSIGEAAAAVEAVSSDFEDLRNYDFTQLTTQIAGVANAWGINPGGVENAVDMAVRKFDDLNGDPIVALNFLTETAKRSKLSFDDVAYAVQSIGGKMAAVGMTAPEFAGLFVQAANSAAGPEGIAGIGTAIDGLFKKIGTGDKKAMDVLDQLGLNKTVADFKANKISYTTLLEEILQKLVGVENPAKRSADALLLFGPAIDKIGGTETLSQLQGFSKVFQEQVQKPAEDAKQSYSDLYTDIPKVTTAASDLARGKGFITAGQDTPINTALKDIDTNSKKLAISIEQVSTHYSVFGNSAGKTLDQVNQKTSTSLQTISNAITQGVGGVLTFLGDVLLGVTNILAQGIETIGRWATELIKGVQAAIKVVQALLAILNQVIQKFGEAIGLKDNLGSVGQKGPSVGVGSAGYEAATGTGAAGGGGGLVVGAGGGGAPSLFEQKALGGELTRGAITAVGEEGMELIDWTGSAPRVINNRQSRQMLGSGNGGDGGVIRIEVPVMLDGAQIARVTAKHRNREALRGNA